MSLLRNFLQQSLRKTIMSPVTPSVSHSFRFHQRYNSASSTSRLMQTSTSLTAQHLPATRDTIIINENARKRLKEILTENSFLRVMVDSGGCSGFQYRFELDEKLEEDDIQLHLDSDATKKTLVVIDPSSLDILKGSTVDYETELIRCAFRIVDNPQAEQGCSCGASFNVKID